MENLISYKDFKQKISVLKGFTDDIRSKEPTTEESKKLLDTIDELVSGGELHLRQLLATETKINAALNVLKNIVEEHSVKMRKKSQENGDENT